MSTSRTRWGALALAVAGVLFVLYPAVRPWHDESTVEGAIKSMSSGAWVAAHLFAMVGFILVALGLLAVWNVLRRTRAEGLALAAVVTGWIGVGLTLPYYGAEDFGLNAIARKASEGKVSDLLHRVDHLTRQQKLQRAFARYVASHADGGRGAENAGVDPRQSEFG